MSWHFLCLEAVFHSHISFFWHFRTLQTKIIQWTTRLAQSPSCTTKPPQRISQYILLRTTKFAQSSSQYNFVQESLHKVLPTTTSYYKACTKYFPVQLRTKKLASTTSYYNPCTKSFPVLLRTSKLAQSTSQSLYYFVLQSLHKVLPSTTSY